MILTKSKLDQLKEGLGRPRVLWGFAVSPEMLQALKSVVNVVGEKREGFPSGVPIIVDPRRSGNDKAEAHFNHRIWMERVREQNKWDELQNNSSHSKEGGVKESNESIRSSTISPGVVAKPRGG